MKKFTRNILIGSGVILTAAAVARSVSKITSETIVSAALDREFPQRMKNKGVTQAVKDEAMREKLKVMSEKLENSNTELVEIDGFDGERLVGHYKRCSDEKRIIIAMHGWRSSWTKDFGAIADFWEENGCSVLYVEQRGQGASNGDYMGFGMIERYDCLEWIKWVEEHNIEGLPIYLAGVSMGASTVLMASGFELPASVHGIMADCGFTSAKAIWKHVVEKNMNISYNLHSKMIEDMCKKKINLSSEEYTTLDALKENKIPVLFVHGTDDDFVPVEMTYENYKACTAPKTLFVVPGAAHAMSYIVDREGYENTVKQFWKNNDKRMAECYDLQEDNNE